jgi:PST family polysaccharide transporter
MLAGALAIALAAHGFGASALIVFNVTTSAITTIWSLVAARIPLGNLHFLTPLRRILSFAGFQAGFGIINYFSRNLDNFVVGKVLGMDALGFYDKAYKLTTYPLSYLASIVGTVLQPYLAESQDHLPYVFKQWKKTAKLLSLIGVPLAVIIVSCASEITTILYGSQWELSIPILQILGLSVYFQIVNNPTGAIFQSTNRTDLLFAHSVAATALTVSGLGIGIALGNIKAVAWGITIAYCLHTLSIAYFLIWKVFHQNIWCYLRFFLPEIVTGIPIGALIFLVGHFLTVPIVAAFIIKSCIIIALFSLSYRFSGQWEYLLMLLKRPVKTRNSAKE